MKRMIVNIRPHPGPLPRGEGVTEEQFQFCAESHHQSNRRLLRETANVSPSPRGEGRGEGGCKTILGLAFVFLFGAQLISPAVETNALSQITNPPVLTSRTAHRYKVAVADIMILKRQKLGAFQLAKDLGADGVEVDLGGLGVRETFDNQLTNAATRQQFLDKAKELGLEISSLAMTGFFAQSFAERPTVPRMIQDCVDTMTAMNVMVAFLPLGVQGDLQKKPELRPAIVARLKMAGAIATKAGVVIGVETSLSRRKK
jgi:hypothetical protein